MSQQRFCCLDNCASTSRTHRLFRMPHNQEVRALWHDLLTEHCQKLVGKTVDQTKEYRVCELHFEQISGKNRTLKECPTLFTEEEIQSRKSSVARQITTVTSARDDHTYVTNVPPVAKHFPLREDNAISLVIQVKHDHNYNQPMPPLQKETKFGILPNDGTPRITDSEVPSTSKSNSHSSYLATRILPNDDTPRITDSEVPLTSKSNSHSSYLATRIPPNDDTPRITDSEVPSTSKSNLHSSYLATRILPNDDTPRITDSEVPSTSKLNSHSSYLATRILPNDDTPRITDSEVPLTSKSNSHSSYLATRIPPNDDTPRITDSEVPSTSKSNSHSSYLATRILTNDDTPRITDSEVPSTSKSNLHSSYLATRILPNDDTPRITDSEVPSTSKSNSHSSYLATRILPNDDTPRITDSEVPSTSKSPSHGSYLAKNITTVARPPTRKHTETLRSSTLASDLRYPGQKHRMVKSINNLTPKCRKLYTKCVQIVKSKRRLLDSYEQRLTKAQDMIKEKDFDELITNLSPKARLFLRMQINQANVSLKLRRYTLEEKLLALQLLKQSPKGYKLLRRIFILPSRRTLTKVTQNVILKPGINPGLFAQMKDTVQSWDLTKKLCSIIFDEVGLTPGITFLESQDRIEGFVDYGKNNNEIRFADHALVFMVRGLITNWTQVVAYYLIENATPAITLKAILKDIVDAVGNTELSAKVLICDQGPTFRSCVKNMQSESRREQILNEGGRIDNKVHIGNHKLNIIFDPPHLIKGIRNNFLTKDMLFDGKLCSWNDIIEVYQADCQLGEIKMLHKLTDEHVMPDKLKNKKMKVKNCVQVLSEKTSAVLKYTALYAGSRRDGTPVSETMLNTAEAVLFFDRLFDSANGSRRGSQPGKMRGPVKEVDGVSKHVSFWTDAIKKLEKTTFLDTSSTQATKAGGSRTAHVPSVANWITTIKSFIQIWDELKALGVKFFYTRNLNQDPLENFFGRIRAYNYRENDPDPYVFVNTLKSLLISGFLEPHSSHFNCEDDMGNTLFRFLKEKDTAETFISNEPEAADSESPAAPSTSVAPRAPASSTATRHGLDGNAPLTLFQQARKEKTSVHASAFTAGYVSRKLVQKVKCQACKKSFLSDETLNIHDYISCRERSSLHGRNLMYPKPSFVMAFRKLVDIINHKLDQSPRSNVVRDIKAKFLETDLSFLGCPQHHEVCVDFFVALVCRVHIHNQCNIINRIIKGAYPSRLESQSLTNLQSLALDKFKSHSHKKK